MDLSEAHEMLMNSQTYKEWKKEKPDNYLTYCFVMAEGSTLDSWQLGFYDKATNKITDFMVSKKVTKSSEADVFTDNPNVSPVVLSNVKVGIGEALAAAESVQKERYKSHVPLKKIAILQFIDGALTWNITYVTKTFNTLNIRIDAVKGKVLKDEILSIFRVEK